MNRQGTTTLAAALTLGFLASCNTTTPPRSTSGSGDAVAVPLNVTATYYVDNRSGSNCSNTGAGTAQSAPWCDFTPINARTFAPGNLILLARGATWNQQLTLNGSGNASNYIAIDAYSSGNRPKIIRNSQPQDRGIRAENASYISISNLEIGNAGSGILLYYTTNNHAGIRLHNLFIHHIYGINRSVPAGDHIFLSSAVNVTGAPTITPSDQTVLSDVRVANLEVSHSQNAFALDWDNSGSVNFPQGFFEAKRTVTDVTLQRLYVHDMDAQGAVNPFCPDVLRFGQVSNIYVFASVFSKAPQCAADSGTATVFLVRSEKFRFYNNIFVDLPYTGSYDETAVDHEAQVDEAYFRGNYFGNNSGPGIEYLTHPPADLGNIPDHSVNHDVAGNLFVNNGLTNTQGSNAAIVRMGTDTQPTGTIRNNIYYQPNAFLGSKNYPSGQDPFGGFTLTNNRSLDSVSNAYHSGQQFSSTQGANGWSYQYKNGATWSNLPAYDTTYDAPGWSTAQSDPFPRIAQFELLPAQGNSSAVARTWTAPAAGTASLRGWIIKADDSCGDGVLAQITQNGQVVWGPQQIAYNDRSGVETTLDNLTVSAGDLVRFEVSPGSAGNNGCDWVSWSPIVGFYPVTLLQNSGFETPGQSGGYQYNPVNASWSFVGSSGITGNNNAFTQGSAVAPQGAQVAFLQAAGSMSQTIASGLQAGTSYRVKFSAAQRTNVSNGGQDVQVLVDGTSVGSFKPTNGNYTTFTSNSFVGSAGSHVLAFQGLNTAGGDNTILIDDISVVPQ